jgi:hypothetical protein
VAEVIRPLSNDPGTISSTPHVSRTRLVFDLFLASAVVGTGVAHPSPDDVRALQVRMLDTGTSASPVSRSGGARKAEPDLATAIRETQHWSGLTWGELADALGVSVRAVHHWSAGRRLSARHVDRVHDFIKLASQHRGRDATETRSRLVAPSPDGSSPFSRFRDASKPRRIRELSEVSIAGLLEHSGEPITEVRVEAALGTRGPRSKKLGAPRGTENDF